MGITIQTKTDYSFLFSGLSTSNTGSGFGMSGSWLSDYASIKNGSYGKLMRAYYNETSNDSVSALAEKKDTNKMLWEHVTGEGLFCIGGSGGAHSQVHGNHQRREDLCSGS